MSIPGRYRTAAASIFIATILGLQTSAIVAQLVDRSWGGWYWPIMDYPMYSTAHFEGEVISARDIVVVELLDGSEIEISEVDLGLRFWHFRILGNRIKSGDVEAARTLTALHPSSDEIAALRIETFPMVLTKGGPRPEPSKVLVRLELHPIGKTSL